MTLVRSLSPLSLSATQTHWTLPLPIVKTIFRALRSGDDDFDGDDYGDFEMGSDYEDDGASSLPSNHFTHLFISFAGLYGSEDDTELENMFLEAKDLASDTDDKSEVLHHFTVIPTTI